MYSVAVEFTPQKWVMEFIRGPKNFFCISGPRHFLEVTLYLLSKERKVNPVKPTVVSSGFNKTLLLWIRKKTQLDRDA